MSHRNNHYEPEQTDGSTVLPPDALWPSHPLPSREHDLGVLAWLQTSQNLSIETTGYICDALLQWAQLGEDWPDAIEPNAGPDCDHLEVLVQVTERWMQRALTEPIARRLELARVGRGLGTAIRCQRDPDGLAESRWRELTHTEPGIAGAAAPYVMPDGRVL